MDVYRSNCFYSLQKFTPLAIVFVLIVLGFSDAEREHPPMMAAEPISTERSDASESGMMDWDRCGSVTKRSRRRKTRHGPHGSTPNDCVECHCQIVNEWRMSAHAKAWTNPAFIEETENRTKSYCLACHAPSPLLERPDTEKPVLRNGDRHLGVDCHACHYTDCAYAGPYQTLGPHQTKEMSQRMSKSSFCGSCHTAEYGEFSELYVPSLAQPHCAKQCAECHMPARISRLTQGHILSLAHPKRMVRDHSIKVWTESLLRGAVVIGEIKAQDQGDEELEVAFTLTNHGAGHRVPSGNNGHREVLVQVELLAPGGKVIDGQKESLMARRGEGLAPGVATPFSFSFADFAAGTPTTIRVIVERVNEDRTFRRTLASCSSPLVIEQRPKE